MSDMIFSWHGHYFQYQMPNTSQNACYGQDWLSMIRCLQASSTCSIIHKRMLINEDWNKLQKFVERARHWVLFYLPVDPATKEPFLSKNVRTPTDVWQIITFRLGNPANLIHTRRQSRHCLWYKTSLMFCFWRLWYGRYVANMGCWWWLWLPWAVFLAIHQPTNGTLL